MRALLVLLIGLPLLLPPGLCLCQVARCAPVAAAQPEPVSACRCCHAPKARPPVPPQPQPEQHHDAGCPVVAVSVLTLPVFLTAAVTIDAPLPLVLTPFVALLPLLCEYPALAPPGCARLLI